jgi:phospholipid transport system substrate-binding protein
MRWSSRLCAPWRLSVADCRLPLAADPVALRGLVDQHLRPADVLYGGQLILGRHWSDAGPDQRRRFAEALYGTLVSRYATGCCC